MLRTAIFLVSLLGIFILHLFLLPTRSNMCVDMVVQIGLAENF